ncbi:hypothetical protein D3C71_436000 [compost metagenome]
MKINLTVSPLANVLALVNEKNGTLLSVDRITSGPAVAPTGETTDNTEITLTGIAGHGYIGSLTYTYDRATLASQEIPTPSAIDVTATDTEADVKTKVAAALRIIESAVDFTDLTIPVDATDGTVTVTPASGNLLYIGAPLTVALHLV